MAEVISSTKFSKEIYAQAARKALEYAGHLSHPVGMAVHDVGDYRDRPLEAGIGVRRRSADVGARRETLCPRRGYRGL
jgi:hypothetical protein